MSLTIVADENMPGLEMFARLGTLRRVEGRSMTAAAVADADILLVRSVTKVNRFLLQGSRVQFVGTATIGIDHLDTDYLESQGIGWSNAPGSNANSVAEYVLSVLCHYYPEGLQSLHGKKAGIVGFGLVGRQVCRKLETLGFNVHAYDPLLAPGSYPQLTCLERVFEADLLCIHAPLTTTGDFPSQHMIGAEQWRRLRPDACLISAGRGGVMADSEFTALLNERPDIYVAMDVWEGEPSINWSLAERVNIATPHIAGYSFDGKLAGTEMIYQACLAHFDLPIVSGALSSSLEEDIDMSAVDEEQQLSMAVLAVYDVLADSDRFKALCDAPITKRAKLFDAHRKHYPERRECSKYRLIGLRGDKKQREMALALGFML